MKKILKYMNSNNLGLSPNWGLFQLLIILFILFVLASISLAQVPQLINYQGRLIESGTPVTGDRSMTFRIYTVAIDGTAQWTEVRDGSVHPRVSVTNGVFSIKLGEFTSIPSSVFSGASTYLETQVGTTILGRERLVAVPYAYHSALADRATIADSVTGGITVPGSIRLKDASLQFQETTQTPPAGMFDIVSGSNVWMFRRITSPDWSTARNIIEIHPSDIVLFNMGLHVTDASIYSNHDLYCRNVVVGGLYASYLQVPVKYGLTVDIFKNIGNTTFHIGGLVKLSETEVVEYWGKDNMIPISGIVISDTSEDTKVIGFVSGKAKGFKKGEEPPKEGEDLSTVEPGEYAAVVTLGSFAICKVDATNGPIKIGDLLTSSSNPGYAMKAKEPKIGTIIGKALQNLDSGTGTIGVLVGAR